MKKRLWKITFIILVLVNISTVSCWKQDRKTKTNPESPYIGKQPMYSYFTDIGTITTKTMDEDKNYSVTVVMNIGYDKDDMAIASELSARRLELRDFTRSYFSGKYAAELQPKNEARLKLDITEILNTRFLNAGKARIILFDKLDVMEIF